jgi:hypothetical protein
MEYGYDGQKKIYPFAQNIYENIERRAISISERIKYVALHLLHMKKINPTGHEHLNFVVMTDDKPKKAQKLAKKVATRTEAQRRFCAACCRTDADEVEFRKCSGCEATYYCSVEH